MPHTKEPPDKALASLDRAHEMAEKCADAFDLGACFDPVDTVS